MIMKRYEINVCFVPLAICCVNVNNLCEKSGEKIFLRGKMEQKEYKTKQKCVKDKIKTNKKSADGKISA